MISQAFLKSINLGENKNQHLWENFNFNNQSHSFYQSSVWATYLKKKGIPHKAFEVFDASNRKIAQLLCWAEPPAFFAKYKIPSFIVYFIDIFFPRVCWKDGPVINADCLQSSNEILNILIKKIKPRKILSGICPFQFLPEQISVNGLHIATYGTYVIDLKKTEEELFNKLKPSAKKNLKKQVMSVRFLEEHEFSLYVKLLKEYRSYLRLPVPYHSISPALLKICQSNAFYRHVGVFEGCQLVGALGLLGYKGKLIETGVVRRVTSKIDTVAQDHIKWFVIKNAASWGFHEFDLAGFNPDDKTEKGLGIKRFKEKWGGQLREFTHIKKSVIF